MPPQATVANESAALPAHLSRAIGRRYAESRAERYGITPEAFQDCVAAAIRRSAPSPAEAGQVVASLHVEELVLARACVAGNNLAWDDFIERFRPGMIQAARQIAREDAAGRELADGLYAELFGLPNRDGRRVSRLDYYMGRGSLAGWLRTVLAQRHIDQIRTRARVVSLDEQVEAGASFAAPPEAPQAAPASDDGLAAAVGHALAELESDDRFLLASYYLDRRTLAAIGRQLGVHESTVCRKLEKLTQTLRKRIHKKLIGLGLDARRCDEIMADLDVRDLNVDVKEKLGQERNIESF